MKLKKSLSRILVIAMLLQTFVSIGMQQSVFAATVALPLVNSMTYSADLDCFIAVGSTNSTHTTSVIMTSTDGLTWTVRSGGAAIAIGLGSYNATPTLSQGVVWGNNQAVALQKLNTGGKVLVTNSDISNWGVYPTTNTLGTTIYLGAITWDAASQKYYAVESVTNNDSIYYATDPTATNAWTKITLTTATSSIFMHIASNNYGTIAVSGAGGKTAIITAADSSATPAQSGGISGTTVAPLSINYDGKTDGTGKFIATKSRDAALYYLTGIGTTPVWTKINADVALPTGWTSASSYYAVAGNGADIIALPQGTNATTASAVAMSYVNLATITTTTVKPAIMDTTNLNNLFATSPVWGGGTNQTRFYGSAAKPGGVIVAAMFKYASGTPGANSFIVIDNVESATTATATLKTSPYTSYDSTIVGNLDYTLNSSNPIYVPDSSATYLISNTTVKDTARNTLTGKTINWSIPNAPTGVSVNSSTGAVTVTSSAPVNTTFVLQATSANQPSVVRKQTFTLQALPSAAPTASSVTINGYTVNPKPGDTLTASYTYNDANSDVENGTSYRWLESSDPAFGSLSVVKEGTTTQTTAGTDTAYLITSSDLNKYIKLEITPKNLVSPTTGTIQTTAATAKILVARYILKDDFEDLNLTPGAQTVNTAVNGWTPTSGTSIYVGNDSTTYLYSSTNAAATDITKTLSTPLNATTNPYSTKPLVFETRMKTPAAGSGNVTTFQLYSNTASNKRVVSLSFGQALMWLANEYKDSSTLAGGSLAPDNILFSSDTWYYIRTVVDFQNQQYYLYLGTTLDNMKPYFISGRAIKFYANGSAGSYTMESDIQKIDFNAGSSTRWISGFDDVNIYVGSTIAPVASNVILTGKSTLTASYAYNSAEYYDESLSKYTWYSSTDNNTWTAISGATGTTTATTGTVYNRTVDDMNKYIKFEVVPTNYIAPNNIGVAQSAVALPVYKTDVTLVNANTGLATTLSAGGDITSKVVVTNNDTLPHTFIVIMGIYNGTDLVGVGEIDEFTVANGTPVTKTTTGVNIPVTSGYSARIFMWKSLEDLAPMTIPVTFN